MFRLSQIQIILLLILCNELVQAASTATSGPQLEEPSATSVDNRPKRTLFNIVLGCASTIIISGWRSAHPNIPPHQSVLRTTFRKLDVLFCSFIAPEILPLWALKQWIAAARIRDIYNNRGPVLQEAPKKADHSVFTLTWTKTDTENWFSLSDEMEDDYNDDWTTTHGHYLIMGGFELIELFDVKTGNSSSAKLDTGQKKTSSDSQNSPTMINDPLVQQITIVDPENAPVSSQGKPRSRARRGQRATIITPELLEILIETYDFKILVTEREINDRSKADVVSKTIFVFQTWWFITQCIARGVQGLDITQLELTTVTFATINIITFILWMKKPLRTQVPMRVYFQGRLTEEERNAGRDPDRMSFRSALPGYIKEYFQKGLEILQFSRIPFTFLARLIILPTLVTAFILSPLVIIISAITFIFYDVMFSSSSFSADASHVPPYYTPITKSSWYYPVGLASLCIVVGGIHCAGWDLNFPTDTQRHLWRVASLAVTIIPFLSLLILTILKSIFKLPRTLAAVIFLISVIAYVVAKIFLVAQAAALLRNLPPSAFLAVDWTKFVPHA